MTEVADMKITHYCFKTAAAFSVPAPAMLLTCFTTVQRLVC
jgi:hypothetical protein